MSTSDIGLAVFIRNGGEKAGNIRHVSSSVLIWVSGTRRRPRWVSREVKALINIVVVCWHGQRRDIGAGLASKEVSADTLLTLLLGAVLWGTWSVRFSMHQNLLAACRVWCEPHSTPGKLSAQIAPSLEVMAKVAFVCLLCLFQHLIGVLFVSAANNVEWSTDQPVVILEKNFLQDPSRPLVRRPESINI